MAVRAILPAVIFVSGLTAAEPAAPRAFPLALQPDDVVPRGNERIALPSIRASDGAIETFNVLSMRDRGLLEVAGESGAPAIRPYVMVNGEKIPLRHLTWSVLEYWIPMARQEADGVETTFTYCAPPTSRAAFVRMTVTNRRAQPIDVSFGVLGSFGALHRVTYTPVTLRGERSVALAPWVADAASFSFITSDTYYSWTLGMPGGQLTLLTPPAERAPGLDSRRAFKAAPGQTVEACIVFAAGVEEYSSAHGVRALVELIDRHGAATLIAQAAEWCRRRARTISDPALDLLMNRNLFFTAFFAWGRTFDTEQFVGITSRSPRYYVSAAYWDRDAMLWSFPGLLDLDPAIARNALEYALTIQLRNTGIHSRFIDAIVLEDGFQLDEAVAPLIALGAYVRRTGDERFLGEHRAAVEKLRELLQSRFDAATGLYSSQQDAQDEYQALPFITYDNALAWQALNELGELYARLKDELAAAEARQRATALHAAVLKYCVAIPPSGKEPIFASATDGHTHVFTEIPPGPLVKLPLLGFIAEDDPLFVRTYDWLHSTAHAYAYADQPYGLPGSYRLPVTASWVLADHLDLKRGREQALKILHTTQWDGGIVTEGLDPHTAVREDGGVAFATAAGYVADAIWRAFPPEKK